MFFPKKVIVKAKGEFKPGLAIQLKFRMRQKSDYYYTVFLNSDGEAYVFQSELLEKFDQDRRIFGMDYSDPFTSFTNQIEPHILTKEEIEKMLTGHESDKKIKRYSKGLIFPDGYWKNLRNALQSNVGIDCVINVKIIPC